MSLNYVSKLVAIASVCFLPEFSVAEVISSEPAARDSRTVGASGTMIDEITVVASRLPVQSYASGRAVTVLDREQIRSSVIDMRWISFSLSRAFL